MLKDLYKSLSTHNSLDLWTEDPTAVIIRTKLRHNVKTTKAMAKRCNKSFNIHKHKTVGVAKKLMEKENK